MTVADEIEGRFLRNLERVSGLVETFGAAGPVTENDDILRAAVVLLHAALEELLRSSVALLLPGAAPRAFEKMLFVPWSGEARGEKLDLPQLAEYRGQTVDAVLSRAIEFHLEHSNYNNTTEVIGTLERLGLAAKPPSEILGHIGAMMKRRHWIVHRADTLHGGHSAQPMEKQDIVRWTDCVAQFGTHVLAELRRVTTRRE